MLLRGLGICRVCQCPRTLNMKDKIGGSYTSFGYYENVRTVWNPC